MNHTDIAQAAAEQQHLADRLRTLRPDPQVERARQYAQAAADELADAQYLTQPAAGT